VWNEDEGEEVGLGKEGFDDVAVDVGEAVVAALEAVGEAFVVEAEEVHDGGLEVVDVDLVFGDLEAHFVGGAVAEAAFDAAAGHEEGEAVGEVVAAEDFGGGGATFAEGSAAEFATPDDEGVFQETALFEVFDEGGNGFVGLRHFVGEAFGEAGAFAGAVEVPAPVEEVDEAGAAFDEAAGEEAVVREGGFAGFGAVGFEGFGVFLADVHDAGDAGLHAEGEFVLGDAGDGLGVAEFGGLEFVEVAKGVEGAAAEGAVHAGGVGDEEDGVAFGSALHALVNGGNEAGAPAGLAAGGLGAGGDEGDEAGEVLVVGAEAVGGPGAHGGAALAVVAGVEEELGGGVVELVGLHRVDETHFIGDGVEVRAGVGHPEAAVAVLLEGARGAHELGDAGGEGERATGEEGVGAGLVGVFLEGGFVVEEVEVRRAAGHGEVDDAFGFGGVVGELGCLGIGFGVEGVEGDGAEGEVAGAVEELTAGGQLEVFLVWGHERAANFLTGLTGFWGIAALRFPSGCLWQAVSLRSANGIGGEGDVTGRKKGGRKKGGFWFE
jgi:hypothetical protein